MDNRIKIRDRVFIKYIDTEQIKQIVKTLAQRIGNDYQDEQICFIAVLNGAFVFAADLVRETKNDSRIYFVKLSSYEGMTSGQVKQTTQLDKDFANKNVVVIEDIIETGNTIDYLMEELAKQKPKSLNVCTLLFKPNKFQSNYKINYVGKEIEDDFVVGYGMDYEQAGRGLEDIYQLNEI
ncbi:MAG: hypoxanthine phosphoribosyltransferase [Bacteroidales bacterium]|jgi:hypoxanthine phosphoribosyltransferase|nr:hypoxanthine phosphoribosyltransferase [Bacteroidales bacterium]